MARFSALSAAIVALAFSSQAALVAGQSMDPCVMKAITAAGCSPQDIKCICKGAAEGSLLTDVLTGMVQYCPKTVDVSGSLAILNAGCKSAGVTIPPKNIQEAQQLAGSVFGGGNGGGSSTGGGSTGGGSNTSSAQGSVVTKPPSSPQETQGLGAPVSQPTAIGQSTAVINTDAANGAGGAGGSNTLIMAPSTTPKPNVAGGSNVSSNQASSSGSATPSGGASAGATGGNNQNAGVRSTASMGAAVIGLAAAVMLW